MHSTMLPPKQRNSSDCRLQAGKLQQQTLTAANVCSTSSGHLFITDRVSKRRYLVKTGSDLCVFPRKLLPGRRERTDYNLYAANGTTIPTYGWTSQNLNLGLRRDFTWRFVVADVQIPIIGVDLLSFYGLLIDCRQPPARWLHLTLHARVHRTAIRLQCEGHRRRHAPHQPPTGIPGAHKTNRHPQGGTEQHYASYSKDTQPTSSLPTTLLGT